MAFLAAHTTFGFCWWDLVTLLVLIGVIVVFIVKTRQQKKQINELEEAISALCAEDVSEGQK